TKCGIAANHAIAFILVSGIHLKFPAKHLDKYVFNGYRSFSLMRFILACQDEKSISTYQDKDRLWSRNPLII
ncbi:MAG: hypothetical protein ACKVHM_09105, partial [Pseudomonadales bacterium]